MLLAEIPQHLGEDKGEILWYNKRYSIETALPQGSVY
jgi:hypothetical protein